MESEGMAAGGAFDVPLLLDSRRLFWPLLAGQGGTSSNGSIAEYYIFLTEYFCTQAQNPDNDMMS
jgi:hypothetical protein